MPSDPTSYTDNPIREERPVAENLRSRENLRRLLLHSPETARLYLSHGLLAGEEPGEHAGSARRILHEQETLARGPGGIMGFKSPAALDAFRARAASQKARGGYRFEFKRDDEDRVPVMKQERAEREGQALPLYRKFGALDDRGTSIGKIGDKTTGGLIDTYSLFGISKKREK